MFTSFPGTEVLPNVSYNDLFWSLDRTKKRDYKVIEEPVIMWEDRYEDNPKDFLKIIQQISDYMLLNENALYSYDNPNQPYLIDAVAGRINPKDYEAADYTYRAPSPIKIKDNHFYYSAKTYLQGEILAQPFQFSTRNVSNSYSEQQKKKMAKKGAKLMTNLIAEHAEQQGVDLSFVKDPSVNMTGSPKEIFDRLKDHEKLENIIHKLLMDMNYRYDVQDLHQECFGDKFDVNAQFAHVKVVGDNVVPVPLKPKQVSWIANKRIKTLEDPAVIAASCSNFISPTELLNTHGMKLNTGTGAKGILDALKKIIKGSGSLEHYDPDRNYFGEYIAATTKETSDPNFTPPDYPQRYGGINWMKSCFYPSFRQGNKLNYSILEQKIYFKVIVPTRYAVEFNGKAITKSDWEKWLNGDYSRDITPSFTKLKVDQKRPEGSFVVDKPLVELWEATRLGHATLIDVGRYKYAAETSGQDMYYGIPIIAQISYDKSMALIGYNLAIWTNVIFNRVEEITISVGRSSAILIDEVAGIDPMSYMYNARRTGFMMFNSSKMQGANQFAQNHLKVVTLNNNVDEIQKLMTMAGMLKIMYENMVGVSPQSQGVSQKYDGLREAQMNIANQNLLKQKQAYEDNKFMNQLLQRAADILKVVKARDDSTNVFISDKEREYMRLSKDTWLADYDIFLQSGQDMSNKNRLLDSAIESVLQSGGIDMVEALIGALYTTNPEEKMAIFRENRELLVNLQKKQAQQQQEAAMAELALQKQIKVEVPLERENIITEREIELMNMKNDRQDQEANFRGVSGDLDYNRQVEKAGYDSNLRMNEETHKQALEYTKDSAESNQSK